MSIKVKVGAGRKIKAVPKQGQSTSIVAPAERKPQIVPDSVVLGIDTIGNYVQQIESANGIVVSQTVYDQAANVVIGHADTSNAVSTTNPNLSYPKNISIDTFGHITDFENVSFNPLNFSANSTIISSDDITIGTTSLTLGETTNTLEGLTSLNISGPISSDTTTIRSITQGRILFAGANGFVSDSSGLTFDGTSLIASGGVFLQGLQVTGQTDTDSLNVNDLTATRIPFIAANGEFVDSANLTFDGTSITATGAVFLDGLEVNGQTDVDSINVNDLTSGRIVYAGANGELIDSAGMTFDGTSIIATGGVFLDNMSVPGQASLGSVNIIDLTPGRIMYAGANGELIDTANLTFDGVSITATGGVFLDILRVPGQTELGSVNVTDLTSGRVVTAGTNGELVDSNNLRFTGSTFIVDGDADITGNVTIGGNLTLGDNEVDTINVVADFTSDLIPDASDTYSLGTPTKEWRRIFTPTLKSSSGVVTIDENGAFVLPVGGTADRPANNEVGMVRYNTSDSRFEGYDGNAWSELAGSVKDVDKDTFIRAETGPGDDGDDLDFFTAGTQRLQIDQAGDFRYGANSVVFDFSTGAVDVAGQATFGSAAVSDIAPGSVVYTSAGGELEGQANLAWDGTNLTIVGGITVDGDFSTSGGLSGDSLSVGNLSANTMMFVSDTGALSSNNSLAFDGETMVVNAHSTFNTSPKISTISATQVVFAGTDGVLEGDAGLTYNKTTDVISVSSLSQNRVVFAGASGALLDSADFTWDGTDFRVNGNAEFTGDVSIAGNLTLGDQVTDSINVIADFSSDLLPQTDNTFDLGGTGSNWAEVYTQNLKSDTGVVTVNETGAITVPVGTTAQRPNPLAAGMVRFNNTDGVFEGYSGAAWASLGGVKDVDQDTFIEAESSPGADNDELRFVTGGTTAFTVNSNQAIATSGTNNLVFDIGGHIDVSNTVIINVADPTANSHAVNYNYLENGSFARTFTVTKAANTYNLNLLDDNNRAAIEIGTALTIETYDTGNNVVQIGLDPVWQSFVGLREAGVEGTVPNFEFDVYGRVRSLVNIPLSVSSNAVVDFVPSIYGVIEDAVRNGNFERGITVTANSAIQKLDFVTDNFDIDLTGAVTGSGTVLSNSNVAIATSFDYVTLDARYINAEGGDTSNGDIRATKFVSKDDLQYYVDPMNTSRLNNIHIGYNKSSSTITMGTGSGNIYFYAEGTKGGFLSSSFNFGTYFDTTNDSWYVNDGSVFSQSFIDSNNSSYKINPSGFDSRIKGINVDAQLVIGSNLTIANNTISNSSGDITINSTTGVFSVDNSIITNVNDPVNSKDAVNKQFLETEINTLTTGGISISAETGTTDVVALGEAITFAAGEGINTTVSNNQILIAGELASDSNIGVASFNIANFTVAAGDVTVTTLDGGTF